MSDSSLDGYLEDELRRIEASALLMKYECVHCDARMTVDEWTGGLPKTLGVRHEPDCPDALPEWPA